MIKLLYIHFNDIIIFIVVVRQERISDIRLLVILVLCCYNSYLLQLVAWSPRTKISIMDLTFYLLLISVKTKCIPVKRRIKVRYKMKTDVHTIII
jgi:hypothetical protein